MNTAAPALPCDPDLFDLLVCPEARVPLKWVAGRLLSTDAATRRSYRVEQGIPVMLIEESQVVAAPEWENLMAQAGPVGGGPAAVRARHGQA
jgi:uncharacterized protein YbaR (Trm112 family)